MSATLNTLAFAKTRALHLSTQSKNRDSSERRRDEYEKGFKRSPEARHIPVVLQKKKLSRLNQDLKIY